MLSFQRFSGFIGVVSFLIVPLISSTAVEVITPSRSPTLPGGPTALPTPTSTLMMQLLTAKPLAKYEIAAIDCGPHKIAKPVESTPTLPLTGGVAELPSTSLTTLVAVAVGLGVQNYTCATANSIPVALGASATLFDATKLAYSNEKLLNAIPGLSVYLPLPESGVLATKGCYLDILGYHYFDSAGTPTFNLSTLEKIGFVGKAASIDAPALANKGPAGTGAVPWLQLNEKTGYTSIGISQVYRVETAGGNPELTCKVPGVMSIPYAAEYWFFH